MSKPAKKKKNVVEFDAESVCEEMAKELDCDPDDLEVENDKSFEGFGCCEVYRVELGQKEYMVVEGEEEADDLALAIVKQDLEEDPELFVPSFIEGHINIERLRRDLESDVQSGNYDYYNDQDDDDLISEGTCQGYDTESYMKENDEGDMEITDRDGLVEALSEAKTKEELKDPVAYLQEISGDEEGIKQAIEIGGIDIDAAAKEAVSVDGAGHFLSHYDGDLHTSGRWVYWRTN